MNNFNYWLTGLIEGDGTIIIPKTRKDSKGRLLYPVIRIAFHKKDTKVAFYIKNILGYGNIITIKTSNVTLLTFNKENDILNIINILNGKMRTPKILRLYLLIDWYNKYKNLNIPKLNRDNTTYDSNSWFSGMCDADSNFNVILTEKKGNNFRLQLQWRLEFSQKTYHGKDQLYWGMEISNFLDTSLYSRSRQKNDKIYSSFIITVFNKNSINILNSYLKKYPLKSSKYLDYKDWLCCLEWKELYEGRNLYNLVKSKKLEMNNKRNNFNWDHLN